jgi:hypothetical protein
MRRAASAAAAFLLLSAPMLAADRFACYYGGGRLDALSKYDVVVLQPDHYTAADVAQLKSAGVTTVLGYVSLGEDDRLRRGNGKGPGGHASWYLDEFTGKGFAAIGADGQPDQSADWNSYYVDPSDRRWQAAVKDEVAQIRALGMDGVFADTVLLPTDVYKDKTERRMRDGMTRLVNRLKSWTRGGPVYVNNGYEGIERWAPRIDGIAIENSVENTPGFWDDVREAAAAMIPYRARVRVVSLFYIASAADAPGVCAELAKLNVPGSLYVKDADGLALTTLPDATCP